MESIENTPLQAGQQEPETFEFVFNGPDVEDGTMSAREVAEVLSGVSRCGRRK